MKRTSIYLNPEHTRRLAKLGKPEGLTPSHLVRIAVAEFLHRASKRAASEVLRAKTLRK
jgi:hypothetical protein